MYGQDEPRHRMVRRIVRRRPDGSEEVVSQQHVGTDEPPGLRHRRAEYEDLREAAEAGSTQARVRMSGARKALRRQEEEQSRRLRRVS